MIITSQGNDFRTLIILEYRDNIALCIALSEPPLFTGKHAINFYLYIYLYLPAIVNEFQDTHLRKNDQWIVGEAYIRYEVINSSDGKRTC